MLSIFKKDEKTFLGQFKKLCEKYGYDFESVGSLTKADGNPLEQSYQKRIAEEMNNLLARKKARLNFTFRVVKRNG